ncbi:Myeloid leukemia factor [Sesbania bispinosa]|nr:Myeloid leukemia factor [Sesbania bispinosa]
MALNMHPSGFLKHQAPDPSRQRGPIIQELNSDDEKEGAEEENVGNLRKYHRSNNEPCVELPDEELEGKKRKHLQDKNEYNRFNATEPQPQPQAHSFCFQSSIVSYGCANGTYYTSSRKRRTGSDGVTFEESKEANSSTRQASHTISRGLHGKGHTLARKLNSDGKVDTMQTLHNIKEDELVDFEDEWKGKGQKNFPGWTGSIGASHSGQAGQTSQGGWVLPSSEHSHHMGTSEVRGKVGSSRTQEMGHVFMFIPIMCSSFLSPYFHDDFGRNFYALEDGLDH